MSFVNFCRGCGNFVSHMLEKKETTLVRLNLGQQLSKTVVYDVYNLLELLAKHQPFSHTMTIATRQKLQKDVLLKAEHPDLRSVDDELVKEWEMICCYYSQSENCLSISIKTRVGKTYLFEISNQVDIYAFEFAEGFQHQIGSANDALTAFDIVCSYESKDEANDGAEVEAVMDDEDFVPNQLPKLPFTFKRM